jgi:hypothetical protein
MSATTCSRRSLACKILCHSRGRGNLQGIPDLCMLLWCLPCVPNIERRSAKGGKPC